jgi:uncharacterized protein (TIGR02300 family)
MSKGRIDVAKAEWGTKRMCPNCGTRYYDMKKKTPVCPSCNTAYDPELVMKTRRGRATAKPAAEAQAPEEIIDAIPEAADEESEDALIEDAEELSDDSETIEVEKEES